MPNCGAARPRACCPECGSAAGRTSAGAISRPGAIASWPPADDLFFLLCDAHAHELRPFDRRLDQSGRPQILRQLLEDRQLRAIAFSHDERLIDFEKAVGEGPQPAA